MTVHADPDVELFPRGHDLHELASPPPVSVFIGHAVQLAEPAAL